MGETGEAVSRIDKPGVVELEFLGLVPGELRGRVLELGSGKNERLKDTPGLPKDCEIITLSKSIFSSFDPFIRALKQKGNWDRKTVEADALALPFEDQSFDRVLSVDAIPYFLTSKNEIMKAFREVWRVLRPGGEARFFDTNLSDCMQAKQTLGQLGANIVSQLVEPELARKYALVDITSRRLIIRKPKGK